LEHLDPEEAADTLRHKIRSRIGSNGFSPERWNIELFSLPGMPPVEYISADIMPSTIPFEDRIKFKDGLGWTVFQNNKPTLIQIREGPLQRRRFTEAHEGGHIILNHKPIFNKRPDLLPRSVYKLIILRGMDAPLAFQWWRQNENADRFANAWLVPKNYLLPRLDTIPFFQLCQEFIVSAWTMACAIVRAQPNPCVAIPFTTKGPVTPFVANQTARRSDCGLYEYLLHQLWKRPFIIDWPQAQQAMESRTEVKDRWEIGGYVLDCLFFPSSSHPFFLRGRGESVNLIALFTYNSELSRIHKIPEIPYISKDYGFEKLILFTGPVASAKSQGLKNYIQNERDAGRQVQVFRMFGETEDDIFRHYLTDRTGMRLIEEVWRNVDVVVIDDCQYARAECFPVVRVLLAYGKKVVVAGPLRDMRGEPFELMASLNTIVAPGNVFHCHTRCAWPGCHDEAVESQLISDVADDVYHIFTEKDAWQPVCSRHFHPGPLSPSRWPSSFVPQAVAPDF
jgi:thymidine kinase